MNKSISIIILALALYLLAANPAVAAMVRQNVSYARGGEELKGYLAYDQAMKEPRPAILVVHEWWGLNDYIRRRVNQFGPTWLYRLCSRHLW